MHDNKVYLPAAAVRSRYSISDMSLWRWLRDPKLGFPRPMRINGRRFWKLAALEAWDKSHEEEAA
jgi:predicted DNA-binding transcriptional regulator AlpA